MKIGLGVSMGVEVLLDGTFMDTVGVATGGAEGPRVDDAEIDVEETDKVDDDFVALLELEEGVVGAGGGGGGGAGTTVAVTSLVMVFPGRTTSTVVVVSTTEVAIGGVSVVESPPTLTTA